MTAIVDPKAIEAAGYILTPGKDTEDYVSASESVAHALLEAERELRGIGVAEFYAAQARAEGAEAALRDLMLRLECTGDGEQCGAVAAGFDECRACMAASRNDAQGELAALKANLAKAASDMDTEATTVAFDLLDHDLGNQFTGNQQGFANCASDHIRNAFRDVLRRHGLLLPEAKP